MLQSIKDKIGQLLDKNQSGFKEDDFMRLCKIRRYNNLIEDYFGYKPVYVPYGITVRQFAQTHNYGVYLVRMDGHISTVIDGVSVDIFDCTKEIVTNAWRVE